jgi:histidinol dehydrogenase
VTGRSARLLHPLAALRSGGGVLPVFDADSRAGRRRIAALAGRGAAVLDPRTVKQAAKIVAAVREGGDRALLALAGRLDGSLARTAADLLLVPPAHATARPDSPARAPRASHAARRADVAQAAAAAAGAVNAAPGAVSDPADLPAGFAEALERAVAAVERWHARRAHRLPLEPSLEPDDGVEIEEVVRPLARVGVYVPGGRASYPSTVVMTVVPARLAGVAEIVVATPPAAWHASAALRHTLARLGVEEAWGLGGAQAVAALAYGTETLRRVDKIVGPGNAWVTAAKRLVAGDVGIDGLAGPSEVLIVADAGADPALVAADLLAQAEHDPLAAAVLVTPDRRLARLVAAAVSAQLAELASGASAGAGRDAAAGWDAAAAASTGAASAATARAALGRFGGAFVVGGWEEALALVERIAPEHLQLVGAGAEALAGRVRSAGAVFLGAATPEVFGDYVAGPSHVLPTCGSARFASGLGIEDFLRRSHRVRFSPPAAARWAEAAACLAEAEGLPAHAAAARRRLR